MKRSLVDPFLENVPMPFAFTHVVLGVPVRFASNRRWLRTLADDAFAGLPTPESIEREPQRIRLLANDDLHNGAFEAPPDHKLYSNGTVMAAIFSPADAMLCVPAAGSGLVTVSEAMRKFPYHIRYEMIEQAACILAGRRVNAVPLHAGCVARDGRGMLIFGQSGAGKSTLTFACLTHGWNFVSEDGAFVVPRRKLIVRGAPNFIHLMEDAVRFFDRKLLRGKRIVRRSGRAKIEIDMRKHFRHALMAEARLRSVVFMERRRAGDTHATLTLIPPARARRLIIRQQPFASSHPQWGEMLEALSHLPAYLLRPGCDVRESVALLERI